MSPHRTRGTHSIDGELSRDEQLARGRDIVMRQLAMVDRSRAQLAQAMERRDVPSDVAEEVLSYFESIGLVDDAHFAEVVTRTRLAEKKASRRAISEELRRKGVDRELVEQAVSTIDPEEELEGAVQLAFKKLASRSGNPKTLYRRTYAMLARRGYSPSQCTLALRQAQSQLAEAELSSDVPEWQEDV